MTELKDLLNLLKKYSLHENIILLEYRLEKIEGTDRVGPIFRIELKSKQ